jgi:hypothetical protein
VRPWPVFGSGCGEVQPLFDPFDALALPVEARLHDRQVPMHVGKTLVDEGQPLLDGRKTHADFAHVLFEVRHVAANYAQVLDDQVLYRLGHDSTSVD